MQPAINPSTVFTDQLQKCLSTCSQSQITLIRQQMPKGQGPKPNIARQNLKKIKKIIESSEKNELKQLLRRIVYPAFVAEYIFGDMESKPVVLNTLRCLKPNMDVLLQHRGKLDNFQKLKKMVQILQLINSHENKSMLNELSLEMLIELKRCLEDGTKSICNNQFRTKWLDKFVEILRCVNFMLRFIGAQFNQNQVFVETKTKINQDINKCIENCQLVTKEVITQLYLASVYIHPEQPVPEPILNQVHYFHACAIVKSQNCLSQLLEIVMNAKDTQIKSQLTPILLKSFQLNYHKDKIDENLRTNSFDIVITLFQVGRSIYSYLQEMIDIIITNGGAWNLQGNFTRRFVISRVALKHVSAKVIMQLWPTIIKDCMSESGNMTIPYVADCTQILLAKLYEQSQKNYGQWMNKWLKQYKQALLTNNRSISRGIIEFVNPIILKIDSNPCLLQQLLILSTDDQQKDSEFKQVLEANAKLTVVSLLKCYRELGKIVASTSYIQEQGNEKNKKTFPKITYIQKYPNLHPKSFIHIDNPENLRISHDFLLDMIRSNDEMISCKALEFLTTSRKPSSLVLPEQMDLIRQFYEGCLKTSMPEYRKNYINLTRKMLERFRRLYEKDIMNKNRKPTEHFDYFVKFINYLIQLSFSNIYPDSIFEITNPAMEILHLIVNLFGEREVEIRKGTFITPSRFLSDHTEFFKIANFYNLVSCLKCSYESIRKLAHKILENFKISKFSKQEQNQIKNLWEQSLQHTNQLSIRSYEFACRLLAYISTSVLSQNSEVPQLQNIICEIPKKYQLKQLNVCSLLLNLMKKRYEIFKQQFIQQSELYYSNLLHGIMTFFSYIFQSPIFLPSLHKEENFAEVRLFLTEFFTQMTQILNFAVQISSANVSTVVLDTLAHGSQTDKKLKVDCRGHFLTSKQEQKGNTIGSYLDSTALLTSMENEEQGIQNTLVVSFYLLTRQAGLVFQSIGELVSNKNSDMFIPKKQLIDLINTYFYALINLKHMGSVDRISIGLSKMSKVIFDHEDPDLNKIPERLLDRLTTTLSEGKFTNILRRSAGVPYAFTCLLKSEAMKRKHLIDKTIDSLLQLAGQSTQTPIQLRIHSLNILKKLFQDSDLKQDLDRFVSDAFIKSINGFTSEEWGVRNSALMLFSVLANRTVGIKPTFNLLQFFHKCPKLLSFIQQKLSSLKTITMYPPLYPIVLLLSRLLPFDVKDKSRITIKGENSSKQVRKEELLKLLPLIRSAGDNHNFMGRVMTAKAILPFMQLTAIVPYCLQLLSEFFNNIKQKNIVNNAQHYRLTQCYQLLCSYRQLTENNKFLNGGLSPELKNLIFQILLANVGFIKPQNNGICSPTVIEIICKVYFQFMSHQFYPQANNYNPSVSVLYQRVYQQLQPVFSIITLQQNPQSTKIGDLGLSLMNISAIQLIHICQKYFIFQSTQTQSQQQVCIEYIGYIEHMIGNKMNAKVDNQIRCLIIQKICNILSMEKSMEIKSLVKLREAVFEWMRNLNLQLIQNDDIMIKVLELLSNTEKIAEKAIYHSQNHTILQYLSQIQQHSQNKYMKMSIFKYFQNTLAYVKEQQRLQDIHEYLGSLLEKYSNPEELQELRETCVQFFEQIPQDIEPSYLLVYMRVLQDEEQQIRKRASESICKILKVSVSNEEILSKKMIEMFLHHPRLQLKSFLKKILVSNSDYNIRYKNNIESRIFSYDKPNKYRTDINTLITIIKSLNPEQIPILKECLAEIQEDISEEALQRDIKKYRSDIMERDQYQFQKIIRGLIGRVPNSQKAEQVVGEHILFEEVWKKLSKI